MADGVGARVFEARMRRTFERGGGVRTTHLASPGGGAREVLTGITEFDEGAALPLHHHDCEEVVIVLEGDATFEADGSRHELVVGDATWTPTGVVHRFLNRGTGRMRIYWTYGSVEATRTLADTGQTFTIAAEGEGQLGD